MKLGTVIPWTWNCEAPMAVLPAAAGLLLPSVVHVCGKQLKRIKMTNYDASPFQHDVAIQHAWRKPANMTLQVYSEWRITILKANFVFLHATVSTKCKIQLGFGCTYQHWIKSHQNRWTIELLSPPPECTLNACNLHSFNTINVLIVCTLMVYSIQLSTCTYSINSQTINIYLA